MFTSKATQILKCPRESDLACIEKYRPIHVRKKRSKGATSFEPQKVCFKINDQHLSTNKGKLFFDACREFLS